MSGFLPLFCARVHEFFDNWGRHGFDVGREALGACRGARGPLKNGHFVVGNNDNFALAA